MIRVNNLKMKLDYVEKDVWDKVSKILKVSTDNIFYLNIVKRSIDARSKEEIKFVCSVEIEIKNEERYLHIKDVTKVEKYNYIIKPLNNKSIKRPVVIGAGPAGIFAALILAQANLNPIVIERGKNVADRKKDVDTFWNDGTLREESNVQFGEGGAGAFSDGKLTTGTRDIRIKKVLNELVDSGAPQEILINQKPHIGTDNLMIIIERLREKIISLGGEFRFEHKLVGFNESKNKLKEIVVEDISNGNSVQYTIETDYMVLAIGHSARDTFKMLYNNKLHIAPKSFAVGVRIEHKQNFINKAQYGKFANSPYLGAAEYKLSTHLDNGRSVYTFCMCPGGVVVASSSEKDSVVVNGMSYYKRNLDNSNSALLVSISPKDFSSENPLSGIDFQRKLEKQAFILGGSNYKAPAQLVGDFLNNKKTTTFGDIEPTYKPGVEASNLIDCFPPIIANSLKQGLINFDKKINGFSQYDAVLTGVETRSSSPVKIFRDNNLSSNIKGLIPCGEGAGYAGGITSAAVDGIKCAEQIIEMIKVKL